MNNALLYRLLADILLIIHALFIAFVVFGFALIVAGWALRWSWVRNSWFRLLHVLAIMIVVLEAWFGTICPLTTWESDLRAASGGAIYPSAFVQYWLQKLIYYDLPPWVFTMFYTIFAALVLTTWILMPPKWPGRKA